MSNPGTTTTTTAKSGDKAKRNPIDQKVLDKLVADVKVDKSADWTKEERDAFNNLMKTSHSDLSVNELAARLSIQQASASSADAVLKSDKYKSASVRAKDQMKSAVKDANDDAALSIQEIQKRSASGDTEAQKAATSVLTPGGYNPSGTGATDPLAAYTPQFLDDRQIEDLARTGQFDITPQAIAKMFPSADLQKSVAQAQTEGLPDPTTLLDQLAPEQYNDTSFVHVGKEFPYQPDGQATAIQRIKDQGLPAWEEGRMIQQVLASNTNKPLTDDDYEAQRRAIQAQGAPPPLMAKQLADLAARYQASQGMRPTTDQMQGNSSLREVVSKPYSWTADQVAATSVEMFKAGYLNIDKYDPTKPLSQQMHITSAFDKSFQKAYLSWVSDSFQDRSKSMMDILKDRQQSYLPQLKQLADQIEASKPKLVVQLSDAQGIRQNAEDFAQKVAGFTLGDDEYQQLISYIHGLQTQSQTAAYNAQYAPGATGGKVQDVDVNARLEAAIRANHPVEAASKDVADAADLMRSLFAGPVH